MKPTLQLRLGQSLTLTPQLRQAIRLLQMSSIELDAEISLALESNPLLERPEDQEEPDEPGEPGGPPPEPAQDADPEPRLDAASPASADEEAHYDVEPYDWDDGGYRSAAADDEDGSREAGQPAAEDLIDHLLWQLNLTPLSGRDRSIAVAIIEAIDENGYLQEATDALIAALRPEIDAGEDEIEAVRHLIQHFDPIGVASRSLAECLRVQLDALADSTPGLALARRIVDAELENLARHGAERLARQLGASAAEVAEAISLVRSLDPRPGAPYSSGGTEYVAPDAYAYRQDGRWHVRLGQGSTPRIGINRHYEALIGSASRSDASYLRGQLQEARWLIRSLETRADTLLRVATAIVGRQNAFLDHGPEAMRPLVLREIADEVGLHESTVSRVTTRKYLHTPRGTFEFKHFFSSSLATVDGGAASSTAIQAMIRRLIEAENPRRPLSDARLASDLKAQGVTVARRTVAKYREAMNIPSSNERQRLG